MPKIKNQKSKIKNLWGFTLIEMLVVFAIIGSLTIVGVGSFFSYSQNQKFQTTVADVSHVLKDIRSRAISQVKPQVCNSSSLRYYQLYVIAPGQTYRIKVMCGTTLSILETRYLPNGVTFTNTSPLSINFFASSGITTKSQAITISGFGKTSTINIDSTGVVSVQ